MLAGVAPTPALWAGQTWAVFPGVSPARVSLPQPGRRAQGTRGFAPAPRCPLNER